MNANVCASLRLVCAQLAVRLIRVCIPVDFSPLFVLFGGRFLNMLTSPGRLDRARNRRLLVQLGDDLIPTELDRLFARILHAMIEIVGAQDSLQTDRALQVRVLNIGQSAMTLISHQALRIQLFWAQFEFLNLPNRLVVPNIQKPFLELASCRHVIFVVSFFTGKAQRRNMLRLVSHLNLEADSLRVHFVAVNSWWRLRQVLTAVIAIIHE